MYPLGWQNYLIGLEDYLSEEDKIMSKYEEWKYYLNKADLKRADQNYLQGRHHYLRKLSQWEDTSTLSEKIILKEGNVIGAAKDYLKGM